MQLSKAFNRKEREANLKPQSSQRTVAEDAERDLVRGQDVIAMVEMPQGNGDVQFPVYVVEKASEDVDVYTSYEVMQSFLEEIDVENNEYEAYDAEGFILRMSVAELQLSWLSLCRTQNRLSCTDFWELKFKAMAHEERQQSLFRSLKRRLGLIKS